MQEWLSMIKHLDENGMGYFEHWWRAMKLSGALFIHAFLPDVWVIKGSEKLRQITWSIHNKRFNK